MHLQFTLDVDFCSSNYNIVIWFFVLFCFFNAKKRTFKNVYVQICISFSWFLTDLSLHCSYSNENDFPPHPQGLITATTLFLSARDPAWDRTLLRWWQKIIIINWNYPLRSNVVSTLMYYCRQMEAKVVMAKLLQRFNFDLTPGQSFDIRDLGALRPKGGVICTVTHRKHYCQWMSKLSASHQNTFQSCSSIQASKPRELLASPNQSIYWIPYFDIVVELHFFLAFLSTLLINIIHRYTVLFVNMNILDV